MDAVGGWQGMDERSETVGSWLRGLGLFAVLDLLMSAVLSRATGWSFVAIFFIVSLVVLANAFMMTFDEM
jgi:hypothetical protein